MRAVGVGLRALHDALPVAECPWEWSTHQRIADAAERGTIVAEDLLQAPPIDRPVVCHGDACMPNTLLDADGRPTAFVDLAEPLATVPDDYCGRLRGSTPDRGAVEYGGTICDTTRAGGPTDLFRDGFATGGTGQWSGISP